MNFIYKKVSYFKELLKHEGFLRYSKNTIWLFVSRLFSMLISFIATFYIARELGPLNYGELSYAISFVSIFSFIAVLGIDQVLYRDLIQYPEKKDEYMGSAFLIRIFAALFSITLCIAIAFAFSPKDVSFYLICLLSLSFIFNSFQIVSYEFQAKTDSKYTSIVTIYSSIILNTLKIVTIALDGGVIYLVGILVFESILISSGYIYYRIKIYGPLTKWKYNSQISFNLLRQSWPLMFSSAFALIYARIDQIMIKNIMNAESVGLYDAAVRLSEVWYFVPSILIGSTLPAIINARKISIEQYYSRIKKVLLLVVLISTILATGTYIFSNEIVNLVFGNEYAQTVPVLRIYIWSNIATALNAFMSQYLLIENRTKTIFISSFVGMSLNVILNIILIPVYGNIGAAFSTLISYFIIFFFIFTVRDSKYIFRVTNKQ